MRREKCLAIRAHQQIDICCETLCDKEVVQQYIAELEAQVVLLSEQLENLRKLNEPRDN
jgi:hypothetical protein